MIPRFLLRVLVLTWLMIAAVISLSISIGHVLPAGSQMLYTKVSDNNLRTISIFLRDTDRNVDIQLTKDVGVNALASWSPDGQKIAYLSLNDNLFHLYLMTALGQDKHRLETEFNTVDSTPNWSPDGNWLLVSGSYQNTSQLILYKIASQQSYTIPKDAAGQIKWTPDSRNIFYQSSSQNGTFRLFGMNISCLEQSDSCRFAELDFLRDQTVYSVPVWSPDKHRLAFSTFDQGKAKIIVARLRCLELTANCVEGTDMVINTSLDDTNPLWSLDGKQLVFVSGHYALNFLQLESGKIRSIILPGIEPFLKDWSPDGKFIGYLSEQTGLANMYLLDVASGESHPMLKDQNTAEFPTWRPNPH